MTITNMLGVCTCIYNDIHFSSIASGSVHNFQHDFFPLGGRPFKSSNDTIKILDSRLPIALNYNEVVTDLHWWKKEGKIVSYVFIGKINICGTDSLPGDG